MSPGFSAVLPARLSRSARASKRHNLPSVLGFPAGTARLLERLLALQEMHAPAARGGNNALDCHEPVSASRTRLAGRASRASAGCCNAQNTRRVEPTFRADPNPRAVGMTSSSASALRPKSATGRHIFFLLICNCRVGQSLVKCSTDPHHLQLRPEVSQQRHRAIVRVRQGVD